VLDRGVLCPRCRRRGGGGAWSRGDRCHVPPEHQGAQRSQAARPRRLRHPAHRSRRPRRSRRHRGCPPTTTTDRCPSALGRRLADHPHQLQIEPNRPDHTDQKTHRTRERAPHSATRHRSPTPPHPKPLPTNTTRIKPSPHQSLRKNRRKHGSRLGSARVAGLCRRVRGLAAAESGAGSACRYGRCRNGRPATGWSCRRVLRVRPDPGLPGDHRRPMQRLRDDARSCLDDLGDGVDGGHRGERDRRV